MSADQQLEDLLPGDLFAFVGLHPELSTLRTIVPTRHGAAIVETKGLTGGLHFDARSTRLLGERYAEAMSAARKGK